MLWSKKSLLQEGEHMLALRQSLVCHGHPLQFALRVRSRTRFTLPLFSHGPGIGLRFMLLPSTAPRRVALYAAAVTVQLNTGPLTRRHPVWNIRQGKIRVEINPKNN